eukprot:g1136.t1
MWYFSPSSSVHFALGKDWIVEDPSTETRRLYSRAIPYQATVVSRLVLPFGRTSTAACLKWPCLSSSHSVTGEGRSWGHVAKWSVKGHADWALRGRTTHWWARQLCCGAPFLVSTGHHQKGDHLWQIVSLLAEETWRLVHFETVLQVGLRARQLYSPRYWVGRVARPALNPTYRRATTIYCGGKAWHA